MQQSYSKNKFQLSTSAKFQNKNLNNAVKLSSSKDNRYGTGNIFSVLTVAGRCSQVIYHHIYLGSFLSQKASGMAVFTARGTVGKAIGGAVAPTASAAPIPLNTPSAKRENNGRDPHVNLVPVRNAVVWGQSSSDVPKANYNESVAASQDPLSMMPMMPVSKPAPWANSSTAANVSSAGGPNANWAEDVDSDDDAHDRAAPAPVKLTAGRDLMNLSHPGSSDFERDGRVVNCSTVRHPDSSSSLVVKESLRNRRVSIFLLFIGCIS